MKWSVEFEDYVQRANFFEIFYLGDNTLWANDFKTNMNSRRVFHNPLPLNLHRFERGIINVLNEITRKNFSSIVSIPSDGACTISFSGSSFTYLEMRLEFNEKYMLTEVNISDELMKILRTIDWI